MNKYLTKEVLIGRWLLKSHGHYSQSGTFTSTSSNIRGHLTYNSDSSMNVLILKELTAQKVSDIIAYSGLYSLQPGEIYHHIEISLYEKRNNSVEKRNAVLNGDTLTLTTDKNENGFYEIVWTRNK